MSKAWGWILLAIGMIIASGLSSMAAAAEKPAIVLAAFGTSTEAFATYQHIEEQVRERFPGYELRWAFTSRQVRSKVAREQGRELQDLGQALQALKAKGFSRVAIQAFHIVPGEEWAEKIVRESRKVPGMQVALGKPLLSSAADRERLLDVLAKTFPRDLKQNAVVLVGHGSPNPQGTAAYEGLAAALRLRFPGQNVFLGTVQGQPSREEALAAVKKSGASQVVLVPLLLVAGEHANQDILGDGPESWKSRLLKQGVPQVQGVRRGRGYWDDVIRIYLDHLDEALRTLAP